MSDPSRIRAVLDEAGVSVEARTAFLSAIQASLTSESASIDLPLPAPQHRAWVDALGLISASLRAPAPPAGGVEALSEAVESAASSASDARQPDLFPVRMTRAQFLALKRYAGEQRALRTPSPARSPRAEPPAPGEAAPPPDDADESGDWRSSGSESAFSLSLLDSAALRELAEPDGLVVVRAKRC
jgi:hypothetical protein